MMNMPADMMTAMEESGALVRPPNVEKIVSAATDKVVASMDKAACAICDVACKVEAAAGAMCQAATDQVQATGKAAAMVAAEAGKRCAYTFEVKRNGNGLIESVVARPCE